MTLLRKYPIVLLLLWILASCTKPEEPSNFRSIEDFKGKTVAVCVGSTHDRFLQAHYPEINLYRVDEASYGILPVLNGHISAVILGGGLAKAIVKELPQLTILPEPIFLEPLAIGFKDPELQQDFNKMISELQASDSLSSLVKKWTNDDGTATMGNIVNDGSNGTLQIGMSMVVPYCFLRNNEYCGIDLELLFLFAAKKKLEPKIHILNFSSLIAALNTNKVDAICGGLALSEERQTKALFSDSYTSSSVSIVVLKENANLSTTDSTQLKTPNNSWWTKVKNNFHNNIIREKRYLLIFKGMQTTLYISILSIFFGTLLGAFVYYMLRYRFSPVNKLAKTYIALLRAIPQVVLLMIMYYVVFSSSKINEIAIATITFSLYFSAYVAEMLRVSIDSIDKGQTETGLVLGFSKIQTFLYIVFPQAFNRVFPVYKNQIISLVKTTAIVGFISVQDLTKAVDIIRCRTFEAFFPLIFVALLYFLLAWLLILLLTLLEKKYGTHHKN